MIHLLGYGLLNESCGLACNSTQKGVGHFGAVSEANHTLADPRGAGRGHDPPRRVGKCPECTKSCHFRLKIEKNFWGGGIAS